MDIKNIDLILGNYSEYQANKLLEFIANKAKIKIDNDDENNETFEQLISSFPELSDSEREAIGIFLGGLTTLNAKDVFKATVERMGSDFRDEIETFDNKKLNIRKLTPVTKEGELSGDTAVSNILFSLTKATPYQIPLWNSGFWISINRIDDNSLLDLYNQLHNNEITLGRETSGIVFSNYSAVYRRIITDFILSNVSAVSIEGINDPYELKKLIRLSDLNTLILGLLTTVYPNGINIVRNCKNAITPNDKKAIECSNIEQAKISPEKLLWVDKSLLTENQITHMSNRSPASMTLDSVREYQNTLISNQSRSFKVYHNDSELEITVKSPYLDEAISSGDRWIELVIDRTVKSLTENINVDEKNRLILLRSKAIILNTYNHFYESIRTFNGYTTDKKAIEKIMESLSGTGDLFSIINDEIIKHIENSVSVIGFPNYVCPSCNTEQSNLDIIPMDIMSVFLDLCTRRNLEIRERGL